MKRVAVRLHDGCFIFDIKSYQAFVGYARVALAGIDTIEHAELVRNGELIVSNRELRDLNKDEFYIDQLIGCKVEAEDGEVLGTLHEVIDQGHHDIWVVVGTRGEILIPARNEFIAQVDIKSRRVIVRRIAGLWDES